MKRKIVRHGPSSLTISLPSPWVKKYNLQPGDEANVEEEGDRLIISGKGKPSEKEATITIKEPIMKRLLFTPYIQGFDIIRYNFSTLKEMKFIEDNVDLMYGFEIIRQTKDCITVKNIATVKEDEFNTMVTRLFNIGFDMFDLLIAVLKKKNQESIERIYSLEKSMTKIDMYCRRLMNLQSFYKSNKGSRYSIIRITETIADHIVTMVRNIDSIKRKNDRAIHMFEELFEGFKILKKLYFTRKIESLFEYKKIEDKVWDKMQKEIAKSSDTFLLMNLEGLYWYIHDLSEEMFFEL